MNVRLCLPATLLLALLAPTGPLAQGAAEGSPSPPQLLQEGTQARGAGDLQAAEKAFAALARVDDVGWQYPAYDSLADVYLEQQEYRKAVEAYEQAYRISFDPAIVDMGVDEPMRQRRQDQFLRKLTRVEEPEALEAARELLEELVADDTVEASRDVHVLLADVCFELGDLDCELAYHARFPDDPEVPLSLGRRHATAAEEAEEAEERVFHARAAARWLDVAIAQDPENDDLLRITLGPVRVLKDADDAAYREAMGGFGPEVACRLRTLVATDLQARHRDRPFLEEAQAAEFCTREYGPPQTREAALMAAARAHYRIALPEDRGETYETQALVSPQELTKAAGYLNELLEIADNSTAKKLLDNIEAYEDYNRQILQIRRDEAERRRRACQFQKAQIERYVQYVKNLPKEATDEDVRRWKERIEAEADDLERNGCTREYAEVKKKIDRL